MTIFGALTGRNTAEICSEFSSSSHSIFKERLCEEMIKFLTPISEKYQQLLSQPKIVEETLEKGAQKARAKAKETLDDVYRLIGL